VNIIWDDEKSARLKKERGISFDEVAVLILQKKYVDIVKHPKRPGQRMFLIPINGYIHVVDEKTIRRSMQLLSSAR
jgi:uncharacterized DUF497 family protein